MTISPRVAVPKSIAMAVTSLQLLQMVVGCTINYLAFQYKDSGEHCSQSFTGPEGRLVSDLETDITCIM